MLRNAYPLLIVVLAGCSLAGSNYAPGSSAVPAGALARESVFHIRTLYSFGYHQYDGSAPQSSLYAHTECTQTCSQHLYGTTTTGGVNNAGTIYDVSTDDLTAGYFDGSVVMSFSPATTGSDPIGPVTEGDKNRGTRWLFATASQGGANGKGTVVELRGTGETLSFDGRDGASPIAGLTGGPHRQHGYVSYSATSEGGAHNLGAILAIELSKNNLTSKVLHSFSGGGDGEYPNSQLAGSSGFLGTTSGTTTGSNSVGGTVYEFALGSSTLTTLYTFKNPKDGEDPTGAYALTKSNVAAIYGTTVKGGSKGYGTLYRLKRTGSHYTKVTLHTFAGGSTDGAYPQGTPAYVYYYGKFSGFYGVTEQGGSHNCGTVFRMNLDPQQYAVLYSFNCGKGGAYPEAGLVGGANGLVGTTTAGGAYGKGSVFVIKVP